jgi:predicted nucleic acid-binding protein
MIVVADTSPISYLAQLELTGLLARLYGRVLIPDEVHRELLSPLAPELTRNFALHLPDWMDVVPVKPNEYDNLTELDAGECAAIQLCLETNADLLLVDELKARSIASKVFGLKVAGTLAVLIQSHNAGWIDAKTSYKRLCETTSFRHTPELDRIFLSLLKT